VLLTLKPYERRIYASKTHVALQLAAAVALDTGKIIKKLSGVFDRAEDFLQNGMQNFDYS